MKTSEQYKPNQAFGLLLLGPPGGGKTSTSMCFNKPYFADCDNNLSGATRRLKDKKFLYDTINQNDDGSEVPEADRWKRLIECCKVAAKSPDVDTLIVDSLSVASDYLVAHIMREQNIKQMRIQDWGTYKILMSRFITACRGYNKMFIMTAHEKYDKDEVTGVIHYRVNISGSLADNIGALFSDVWRCECEEDIKGNYKYIIRSMPTNRMALKNSLGLPATFEFTWAELASRLGNK